MRRGEKLKNVEQILNVILIHSKRKGNKERVVVKKKNNKKTTKPYRPAFSGFARRLQMENFAALYSKLCGFNIYLSKEYLLYLL